ncbi:DUF4231 domain-containing protein [Altericista sp. CCNU0014]|uniref:DUF4231 domain-containing protein n=1 Tax=Altericista sp. CCNU0014 TaxID=3082949 RepID=UPI00384B8AAD
MFNKASSDLSSLSQQNPLDPAATNIKKDYAQQLREEYAQVIDRLELDEQQKRYLKSRWLDQVLWMDGRANHARNWYRRLRLTSIVLGVIVPILVTVNVGKDQVNEKLLRGSAVVLSSIIAISAAVEEFNQYGKRWYSYRRSAELLKTNGWQFFQKSGQYRTYKTHQESFPIFVEQVEAIVQRDVEIFVTEGIKADRKEEEKSKEA